MVYNNFADLKISALGMGCMRLPNLGVYENIDVEAVREMVAYSMGNGINYYDTAWGYHGGNSEGVMGEVLSDYPRESFFLATKFPGFLPEYTDKVKEVFEKQLERCRVDYFDFYLFHNVNDASVDLYLDPKYGILDYLLEQKKNGRIRHLGFSDHSNIENFRRFLDAYGSYMEFCQIQLNWLDYDFQDAKTKVKILNEMNIPVWVMEPLRGGGLCQLSPEHKERLQALNPDYTAPEWAFRFLQGVKGVTLTLSGMSNFEQIKQNIETFKDIKPLRENEMSTLLDIAKEMTSKNTLLCTECRYCTERCPNDINIPSIIKQYNKHIFHGGFDVSAVEGEKTPFDCIECACCEEACPQNIKISEMMADIKTKVIKTH